LLVLVRGGGGAWIGAGAWWGWCLDWCWCVVVLVRGGAGGGACWYCSKWNSVPHQNGAALHQYSVGK